MSNRKPIPAYLLKKFSITTQLQSGQTSTRETMSINATGAIVQTAHAFARDKIEVLKITALELQK